MLNASGIRSAYPFTRRVCCGAAPGLLIAFLACAIPVHVSNAQPVRASQMQAALKELSSGSFETGVKMMNRLLDEYPDYVAAWVGLGRSQRQKQDLEGSLETFSKAVRQNAGNPSLMFQLGIAHAYLDQLDESFQWLYRVKNTNKVNLTALDARPVAVHLNKDSRYPGLFPTSAEFADPFVEGARIIHEWVVGAWQNASAAPSGGRIYVQSGKDGSVMQTITGKVQGETLGFDTTGMGDVDGDGTIDFLITSAWSTIKGFQTGRMFIISGARLP